MKFERFIYIQRPPEDVFVFLRDKDLYPQETGSPVLLLEKTSPGPAGVGTRYLEVVQMLPLVKVDIRSEIRRYEPPANLEEFFWNAGMEGYLAYTFEAKGQGTRLIQKETLCFKGVLSVFAPLLERMLIKKIEERLADIKTILESGWQVGTLDDGKITPLQMDLENEDLH